MFVSVKTEPTFLKEKKKAKFIFLFKPIVTSEIDTQL